MKKLFAILIALLCATIVFAQEKPTVVVVPFDAKEIEQNEMEVLFEVFQSEFANTGVAKVVDRSSLDKIRKQQEFQASDWSNADKVAELGKALNASMVVTGQLMTFKKQIVATVKLIDVNTTEIISSVVERVQDTEELFSKLPEMAQDVARRASSVTGTTVSKQSDTKTSTPTKKLVSPNKKYKIGDEGPEGGIVFYVSEGGFAVYDGKGGVEICHYLEVSKRDIGVMPWCPEIKKEKCCRIRNYNEIGDGKRNTYMIIKGKHTGDGKQNSIKLTESNCAAYACYMYKGEGIWYLPNVAELRLLCDNQNIISAYNDTFHELKDWYWSSYFAYDAWCVTFSDTNLCPHGKNKHEKGDWDSSPKFQRHPVRAIHAF